MSWSYDANNITTSSSSGRINSVRLLIGDTDGNDELVQDEEIVFALNQAGNNIYQAGSWTANVIAAKFSRQVNTQLDGALSADYSNLSKQYMALSESLRTQATKFSNAFSVVAGGISHAAIKVNRQLNDRPNSAFHRGQFDNPPTDK